MVDTGGAVSIASRHLLSNIKPAKKRGNPSCQMVTVNGLTPPYTHQGELHFTDEAGLPIVILCYAQHGPVLGHKDFVLIANSTVVAMECDINYHAKASGSVGAVPLKRTSSEPYHYSDSIKKVQPKRKRAEPQIAIDQQHTNAIGESCTCLPRLAPQLQEVDFLRITGRKLRKPPKGRLNPKKDKQKLKVTKFTCFMSEIQLQQLLQRTSANSEDEEAMDMTVKDGIKMSKFDIRAIKIGSKVSVVMKTDLLNFNKKYVGKDSVFPEKNGAPRILEQFKDNPYSLELRDEYTTGSKPKKLPTAGATYYHGKPATRKVLEHFVRTTPVVEKCDDPRCFSRLVIVPKLDPGQPKSAPPTAYRVTMDALINHCLKPVASTLPLATDEIKKLHSKRFFFKVDAMHAFWAIPLDEESKKMLAFQTHEGVFAWSRLTMGCRPASQIQQTAFHNAMDKHMPKEYRHRIAMYADDMAAGADTLEELFEIYKALIIALDKAGIQIKASKVEFGVEEITFHNYRVIGGDGPMANTTTPKDETLDPIRSCSIPQSVTQLKAFLGSTQQMAQYVPYYALIAAPLHKLTRKGEVFPTGSKWVPGSDYDLAYHHVKSLMLDRPLYIWNKDNERHSFLEVDACDDGWGACFYQHADKAPPGEDEGKFFLLSKKPKRIIAWVSKAWTTYEKKSLPVFYKETIARILAFEHFRNLIETQAPGHGVTCYSDHLPGIKDTSLSNKGKLSTWKLHETSDLTSIVTTLYKSGPTMSIADPLSRLVRQEHRVENLDLPVLLEMLLSELPQELRTAQHIRVNAEKDTQVATRIVQRWRTPTNPISNTVGPTTEKLDLLISAPYADKLPLKVAEYIRQDIPFAILVPLPLLNEIDRIGKTTIDPVVREKRQKMKLVISSSLGQAWLINHPKCRSDNLRHSVFFTQCSNNPELEKASHEIFGSWYTTETKIQPCTMPNSQDIDTLVLNSIESLIGDGASRKPDTLTARGLRAAKRQRTLEDPTSSEIPLDGPSPSPEVQCNRTLTHPLHTTSTTLPPKPINQWPALQNPEDIPSDMPRVPQHEILESLPKDLIVLRDDKARHRILVPACQRVALVKTEHETMIHVKGNRVHHELSRLYYWPQMKTQILDICSACSTCQKSQVRRQNLSAEFQQANLKDLPMPRQRYGIDFYGHEQGEILVAIDLCTREATLWFLTNRKQDSVVRALLSGLIFQKGVPLSFRNDEAPEFVKGAVAAMNRYLGIEQITTGSHNPRSNAVVERFMQHLNGCLTKCDDAQYKNMKDFLPAIAFAHNTAFNSAINCTPFEAGHGLRAKTITEARANPRLQITAEEGTDIQEPDSAWEKSVFPKVCRLAERLAYDAQRHSQWHKRMNAHNLNQSGAKISAKGLKQGDRVYFYRPPSQHEVIRRGRKAKHLAHYHGPAIIQGKVDGRDRQYHLTYDGKPFKRDISMLVPEKEMQHINPETHDPTITPPSQVKPSIHVRGKLLAEEDLILCKTDKEDTSWYLAEVTKIFPDEIEVAYYTTPKPLMEGYATATLHQRIDDLLKARFRKTWFVYAGKNAGKGTLKPPFPYNPKLRLWTGKLPANEVDELVLATGMNLDPQGYLSRETAAIAVQLNIGYDSTRTIEDEETQLEQLRFANCLFTYSECALCECPRCARLLSSKGQ